MINNMTSCHFQRHITSQQAFCYCHDLTFIRFSEFWQDVCQQSEQIRRLNFAQWALWEQDSYEFLVLFFAALLAEKTVIIAPHRVKALELAFAQQGIYFLQRKDEIVSLSGYSTEQLNLDDAFLNRAQIYFYTSGSTGEPKKIPRTLKQLLNEVEGLHQSLMLPDDAIAIATVSHQHIYGLLFKLLLPLASGRSFYQPQLAFPEDVVGTQFKLQTLAKPNYVVSSPALLKRWTQEVRLQHCDAVYSSGGKLDSGIRPLINCTITEVLGSSETGGIAYRDQDDSLWTPFSNVYIRVTEKQELEVKTNHAFQQDWILTGDRAKLIRANDMRSSFQLLGRLDRIVKLEEKRLSLDAIEQQILTLDEISQCYALVYPHEHRQILACIAVLTDSARQQLMQGNKATFVAGLKSALKDKLENIAIPRQWRFLTQLPQNSQSKLNKKDVTLMFERMLYPVQLQQYSENDQYILHLEFPPELECFKGHFSDYPIFPGVGQIGFIQHFAKQIWSDLAWCNGYEQLKFQDLIRPYRVVQMKLRRKQHKVHFELHVGDKALASGRLLFEVLAERDDSLPKLQEALS